MRQLFDAEQFSRTLARSFNLSPQTTRPADTISGYAEQIGMSVDTPQVQNMVDRMITANLIHRQSHGVYAAADLFVRQVWRQRKTMQLPAQTPPKA